MSIRKYEKLSKDQLYETKIDDLANGGKGVGRIDGKVVFVENAIPGQTVSVKIFKDKKDFAEGRAVKVVSNSDIFTEPRCPYFFMCGGCKIQNMIYEEQLKYKRKWLTDSLSRIAGLDDVNVRETLASPDKFYYRNKMEFSFANKIWDAGAEKIVTVNAGLGLHLSGRFDTVLNIKECYLQSEQSSAIVNAVRDFAEKSGLNAYDTRNHKGFWKFLMIRESKNSGETLVNIVTGAAAEKEREQINSLAEEIVKVCKNSVNVLHAEHPGKSQAAVWENIRTIKGQDFITEKIGRFNFRIESSTFFQTNTRQAEYLYKIVKESGSFTGNEIVYDLFSGTGTIPVFLSDSVKSIVGFELEPSSVEAAKYNAENNGVVNCDFAQGKVRVLIKYPPVMFKEYGEPDVVITDPPRSGMDPKSVDRLIKLKAKKIIYVSCNPDTLSRDLSVISKEYSVTEIVPVDMFPHTAHLETVVVLDRKRG